MFELGSVFLNSFCRFTFVLRLHVHVQEPTNESLAQPQCREPALQGASEWSSLTC